MIRQFCDFCGAEIDEHNDAKPRAGGWVVNEMKNSVDVKLTILPTFYRNDQKTDQDICKNCIADIINRSYTK